MQLRYPMKPSEVFPDKLEELDKSEEFFCQSKLDGWRCLLTVDKQHRIIKKFGGNPAWDTGNGTFFLTRRGLNKGGPTANPVDEAITDAIQKIGLPDNTMLDTEWVCRRTKEHPDGLWIHDILWLDDQWQGNKPCYERYTDVLMPIIKPHLAGKLHTPETVLSGFVEFFNGLRSIPWTEGVVLKTKDSVIRGDRNECTKVGSWLKVKWRSGHSGRDIVAE